MSEKVVVVETGKKARSKRNTPKGKQTPRSIAGRPVTHGEAGINIPSLGSGYLKWKKNQKRRFNTASSNEGGYLGVMAPAQKEVKEGFKMWVRRGFGGEQCTVLHGTDSLANLSLDVEEIPCGYILKAIKLSPALLPHTRAAAMAPLWERFRFTRLMVHYTPIAGTTASGQILGFYDPDSTASWKNADENFTRGPAFAVHEANQISQRQTWHIKNPQFTNMFTNQTGIDPRLQTQGQFLVMANSILLKSIAPSLGNLTIEYELELYSPQMGVDLTPKFGWLVGSGTITPSKPMGEAELAPLYYSNLAWQTIGTALSTIELQSQSEGGFLISIISIDYTGTLLGILQDPMEGLKTTPAYTNQGFSSSSAVQISAWEITRPEVHINFTCTGTSLVLTESNWVLLSLPRKPDSIEDLSALSAKYAALVVKMDRFEKLLSGPTTKIPPPVVQDPKEAVSYIADKDLYGYCDSKVHTEKEKCTCTGK